MLQVLERVFLVAGAAMLTWYVLLAGDARVAQRAARTSLEAARSSRIGTAASPVTVDTASPPDKAAALPTRAHAASGSPGPGRPVKGAALGELSIPRVGLSAVVLYGSDARTLRRGPGHLEDTAIPGEAGNAVIAGHRDTFFRPLRHVHRGDDIFIRAAHGTFRYRVTSLRVVQASDLSVLAATPESTLTLITCYPFWLLGSAPDRFVVRAVRVLEPVGPPAPTPAPAASMERLPAGRPALESPRPPAGELYTHSSGAAAADDEALVRQALDRFRSVYNARLISHRESRPDGLLGFERCDVSVLDDRATATCLPARVAERAAPRAWVMTLERNGRGWAIRAVQSP